MLEGLIDAKSWSNTTWSDSRSKSEKILSYSMKPEKRVVEDAIKKSMGHSQNDFSYEIIKDVEFKIDVINNSYNNWMDKLVDFLNDLFLKLNPERNNRGLEVVLNKAFYLPVLFRKLITYNNFQYDFIEKQSDDKTRVIKVDFLDQINNSNEEILRKFLNDYFYKNEKIKAVALDLKSKEPKIYTDSFSEVFLKDFATGYYNLFCLYSSIFKLLKENTSPEQCLELYIEEPENGLNPKIQKLIPEILSGILEDAKKINFNIQFIITTHSPFIISAAAGLPNQKVYLLEEGQTKDAETGDLNSSRSQFGYSGYEAKKTSNKMLGAGLDDLMDKIIFCEGSQTDSEISEFDARIYNTIFYGKGYNFVSAGGGGQPPIFYTSILNKN